jgi:hypothetical protein
VEKLDIQFRRTEKCLIFSKVKKFKKQVIRKDRKETEKENKIKQKTKK